MRFFAIGDHDFISKYIDGLKTEEFAGGRIDDPDLRLSNFASPQTHRRNNGDYVSVLRRQSIVSRGSAEPNVVEIGDAASERQKIAVAQSIGPVVRRDEEVRSPTRPFESAFMA